MWGFTNVYVEQTNNNNTKNTRNYLKMRVEGMYQEMIELQCQMISKEIGESLMGNLKSSQALGEILED